MRGTLGELVRSARKRCGLTQEALAEGAGLSVRTVSDVEAGRQPRPKRETLEDILRAFDLPRAEGEAIRAAWRANGAAADNVPTFLEPLVGRTHEVAKVRALLESARLLTLCGLAGVGKTRLALAAVSSVPAFDRVVFVALSGTTSDDDVAAVVLAHVREQSRDDATTALVAALRARRTLLVLDGVEHLRSGVIALLSAVLADDTTSVLITSQLPLSIPGERLMIVEPLPIDDCVALIRERAESAGAKNPGSTAALAALCERLDRLPLAIELAAPTLRTLDAEALRDRLTTNMDLLVDPSSRRRYPTLRDAIASNYAQLGADERRTLRALSTFAAAWPLCAAEDICGPEAIAAIDRLVTANMITRMETADGSYRYRVLGIIRDFARAQLDPAEHRDLQERHVWCAAKLVRRTEGLHRFPDVSMTPLEKNVTNVFDSCIEDMLQAVEAAEAFGMHREALEIVAGLQGYWPSRGRATWAQHRLERALEAAEAAGDVAVDVLAKSYCAAISLSQQAQHADAHYALRAALRSLDLAQHYTDAERCRSHLGVMFASALVGDVDAVIVHGNAGLALAQALGRAHDTAAIMGSLGYAHEGRGDLPEAIAWSTRSLRAFSASNEPAGVARISAQLALQYALAGDMAASTGFCARALAVMRTLEDAVVRSMVLRRLAVAQAASGHARRASVLAVYAARGTYQTDAAYQVTLTADALGFALRSVEPAAALTAFSIADRLRIESGFKTFPYHEARRTNARASLVAALSDLEANLARDTAQTETLRDLVENLVRVPAPA